MLALSCSELCPEPPGGKVSASPGTHSVHGNNQHMDLCLQLWSIQQFVFFLQPFLNCFPSSSSFYSSILTPFSLSLWHFRVTLLPPPLPAPCCPCKSLKERCPTLDTH